MRTLVHMSDLHFGRTDPALLEPVVAAVERVKPDLVVISGDLTQRARSWQFQQAREFLDQLPNPQLVIPGNHDVPLHNVIARFFRPLTKYKRHITDDLDPQYSDDEIVVVGINTARSLTIAGGSIARRQVEWARERICGLPEHIVKIVVTHHPFALPPGVDEDHLVKRATSAMHELSFCGADIFLAGHLHLQHTELTTRRYRAAGRAALIVQAGTGLSTRRRGEGNNFNVIRTSSDEITVENFCWSANTLKFDCVRGERFRRAECGWEAVT